MSKTAFSIRIFDNPSGKVRGIGNVTVEIKGKEKVIGKMTIYTDSQPTITLSIPGGVPFDEIPAVADAIKEFHRQVAEADAGRGGAA